MLRLTKKQKTPMSNNQSNPFFQLLTNTTLLAEKLSTPPLRGDILALWVVCRPSNGWRGIVLVLDIMSVNHNLKITRQGSCKHSTHIYAAPVASTSCDHSTASMLPAPVASAFIRALYLYTYYRYLYIMLQVSRRTWYSNLPAIPGFPFMILYATCTSNRTSSSRSGGSSRMKFVALASAVEESCVSHL